MQVNQSEKKEIDFGDDRNVINQKKCIHCGTCYESCPLSAISAK
jgi:formate hydrogenlyase subunit 6/NADH:ubiquinone oxidoreductase subunit I